MARSLGQRTLLPRVLVWAGLLYLGRGDIERGKACVDEAWELSVGGDSEGAIRDVFAVVPAHIGRAAYHLAMGHYAEAIRVGEHGLKIADRSGYVVWAIHRLMPGDRRSVAVGERPEARDGARRSDCGSSPRRSANGLGLAWADACDALVEMLHGEQGARGVAARRAPSRRSRRFRTCRTRLACAASWRARSPRRATARARCASCVARTKCSRTSAPSASSTRRESSCASSARVRRRARVTQGVAGLTGRELEIVRLVAARRSNKEIGAALGISARTASTHLSNIFAKLGVDSRGELADLAREAGLLERSVLDQADACPSRSRCGCARGRRRSGRARGSVDRRLVCTAKSLSMPPLPVSMSSSAPWPAGEPQRHAA